MNHQSRARTICRAALVWVSVSAVTAGLTALATPLLIASPGTGFTGILVRLCSGAALLAAGCLWLLTTEVAWRVITDGTPPRIARDSAFAPVRLAVLAACGVVALHAPAAAVPGDDQQQPAGAQVLHGLPLPDRADGDRDPADRPPAPAATSITVRAGDCLWGLARSRLGPRAGTAEVASYWRRIHASNRDVIGPDPDRIVPGQQLQLPSTE